MWSEGASCGSGGVLVDRHSRIEGSGGRGSCRDDTGTKGHALEVRSGHGLLVAIRGPRPGEVGKSVAQREENPFLAAGDLDTRPPEQLGLLAEFRFQFVLDSNGEWFLPLGGEQRFDVLLVRSAIQLIQVRVKDDGNVRQATKSIQGAGLISACCRRVVRISSLLPLTT